MVGYFAAIMWTIHEAILPRRLLLYPSSAGPEGWPRYGRGAGEQPVHGLHLHHDHLPCLRLVRGLLRLLLRNLRPKAGPRSGQDPEQPELLLVHSRPSWHFCICQLDLLQKLDLHLPLGHVQLGRVLWMHLAPLASVEEG